jgi:hypothetical protein
MHFSRSAPFLLFAFARLQFFSGFKIVEISPL